MNRHIMEFLDSVATAADGKGSFPGNIWRKIKSKIDAMAEKPEPSAERENPKSGER
jgi:hypothetical protein